MLIVRIFDQGSPEQDARAAATWNLDSPPTQVLLEDMAGNVFPQPPTKSVVIPIHTLYANPEHRLSLSTGLSEYELLTLLDTTIPNLSQLCDLADPAHMSSALELEPSTGTRQVAAIALLTFYAAVHNKHLFLDFPHNGLHPLLPIQGVIKYAHKCTQLNTQHVRVHQALRIRNTLKNIDKLPELGPLVIDSLKEPS